MRFSISPKGLFCKATAILTAAFFISSGIFIPTSFALPMMFTRNETRQFVPVVTLDQANLRKKTADKQDFVPSGVAVQSDSPLLPLRSNLDQTENSVPQTQAPLEEKRIPQRSPAPPPDQIQVLSYGDRYTSTNITQPFASVASPDGKNVYVATSTGIAWFNRDSVSGSLTYVNQISGISGRFIAIAPDGSSVYASTNQNHIVAAFSRDAATGALTQVGLADRADHVPNQLSGGQQQRVAIARALVLGPSLLLADEPTGNLDTRTSIEIMGVFQELNEAGMTVVMVTHELDIARFARRTIIMRDGRIKRDEPVAVRLHAADALARLAAEEQVADLVS